LTTKPHGDAEVVVEAAEAVVANAAVTAIDARVAIQRPVRRHGVELDGELILFPPRWRLERLFRP
jgi:hypothetical protein